MKKKNFRHFLIAAAIVVISTSIISCERGYSEDIDVATFPNSPEVYIDAFSVGLEYYPYADSKFTAFSVDEETKYQGTSAMRFDVPNVGDPEGAYAGAIFRDDNGGRDLSSYDALTFWAKASQAGTLDNVGFGQDFMGDKYLVGRPSLQLTTNWVKYIIPIPDASKLTQSEGMFWYAEGPENGVGYSFWVDNLKYEKLGTVAQPRPAIMNGMDETTQSFSGSVVSVSGLTQTMNTANGQDITVNIAPSYMVFKSSNPAVASVNELGQITLLSTGTSIITASVNGVDAEGSLTVQSLGSFDFAPTPTLPASSVISIFSDAYTNVPVDFFNGYWQPYQTTESADFEINGDNILSYTNFNFVGNQFSSPTVNASAMTHVHFDIFIPGALDPGAQMLITIRDFGADGVDGGSDDSNQQITVNNSDLMSNGWASIDVPLTIANKNSMGLFIYENLGSNLTDFYLDNIYFHN